VTPTASYELVDFGDESRLERFDGRLVVRPFPAAPWPRRVPARWRAADLVFTRDAGWQGVAPMEPWTMSVEGLTLELRSTETGQVGCFPEHVAMLPWLRDRVRERLVGGDAEPVVLNLFASTGLATLALAAAGAAVVHVDGARPTVGWARRNAMLSGLDGRPIRWIVDDAVAFCRREARRGRRYAGIVLDPPSYGHGPGGRAWRLERDLPGLLSDAAALVQVDGFVLLTAHTPGFDGDRLADVLAPALGRPSAAIAHGPLAVTTADGRRLELGAFARWTGRA
jgi:23S rRNA (cytosine1962-C5)-methyltransferase